MSLVVNDYGLKDILKAISGTLIRKGKDKGIEGVSIDSRTIKRGELFFALRGSRDGHCFVQDAFAKGAWGAVVEREDFSPLPSVDIYPDRNIIRVDDTLWALGELAHSVREEVEIPLIAISGTCGKTTTKEMIASILSRSHMVLKNPGNYNNLIGLPLSLLELDKLHDVAVVELGISTGRHEMERLAEISSPEIALLTNIGVAHLNGFGDIKGVAEAKSELFRHLSEDGFAIINRDDPLIVDASNHLKMDKITYGIQNRADVRLIGYRNLDNGTEYEVDACGTRIKGFVKAVGISNIYNLLSSIATVRPLDIEDSDIIEGLMDFELASGRLYTFNIGGVRIIDDTYNANPTSMESSLKAFVAMVKEGRGLAVLGDMRELGTDSNLFHLRLGNLVASLGIDRLYYIGEYGDYVKEGAIDSGMDEESIMVFKEREGLIDELKREIKDGDTIIVKASRAMRMEEVVDEIKAYIEKRLCCSKDGGKVGRPFTTGFNIQ